MSERLPPAVAIFFSETLRRRVMPRLGNARVEALRFDPSATIRNAFIEELSQSMAKAAERLRPDVAPALSIVLITDPAQPVPRINIVELIRKACPPNVAFVPHWVGLYQQRWPHNEGVAFLLSTTWRGALIQGGSLDRAYQSLILSLLATENSRVAPQEFDCFARLRFHSPGKTFKVAIDPIDLPNFQQQAETQLRAAVLASYFPEIEAPAQAALPMADTSSGAGLWPAQTTLEPLLCAAIAQSVTIAQAAATLGDWATKASQPVSELLQDLRAALTHWAVEASTVDHSKANPQLAAPLFAANPFPLLNELKMHRRSQQAFRTQAAALRDTLIQQQRAELDRAYYELLPNDLNAQQRLAIAAELSSTNGSATRLTVTRHFPANLIADTREEILDLPNLSTVIYAMEMRPS